MLSVVVYQTRRLAIQREESFYRFRTKVTADSVPLGDTHFECYL